MGPSPSSETASQSATQEIRNILWVLKMNYRVHKSPPLIPILSQINLVQTTPCYLSKIHFNITRPLCLSLPIGYSLLNVPSIMQQSNILIHTLLHNTVVVMFIICC
jgi:hypothetical protein